MRPAPWYVVLKAQHCTDCASNSLDMTVDLCDAHVGEPTGPVEERAVLGVANGALGFLSYRYESKGREMLDDLLDKARDGVRRYDEIEADG